MIASGFALDLASIGSPQKLIRTFSLCHSFRCKWRLTKGHPLWLRIVEGPLKRIPLITSPSFCLSSSLGGGPFLQQTPPFIVNHHLQSFAGSRTQKDRWNSPSQRPQDWILLCHEESLARLLWKWFGHRVEQCCQWPTGAIGPFPRNNIQTGRSSRSTYKRR